MDDSRKKLEFDELKLIQLCDDGLNDLELAEIFNCSYTCISKYRRNLKIKPNRKSRAIVEITKEELEKLVNLGLTDAKIGKLYNMYASSIYSKRKKFNIERKSYTENPEIQMTDIQKQVLFGCVLGDGYLNKTTNKNSTFEFNHSLKQEEYVNYKFNYFNNFPGRTFYFDRKPHKVTNKVYKTYTGVLYTNKAFNFFKEAFYNNVVKKRIPIELLDEFYTPLAMAIHYCDDGSFHLTNKNGGGTISIATCSFEREELELFKEFLHRKYGLETTVTKSNRIYIKASSSNNFMNLIRPYIIESMQYKLMRNVS